MKKILLSALVIVIFGTYVWHQRTETEGVNVIPPSSLQTQITPTQNNAVPTTSSAGANPPTAVPTSTQTTSKYKDGSYTGDVADAFYGNIQVQAIISGGKITDVKFLQYPNDRGTSIEINSQAMPYLKQEAIQAQSANVDIITGATDSSNAFRQSLQSALSKAT